jgi:hypothetical protein
MYPHGRRCDAKASGDPVDRKVHHVEQRLDGAFAWRNPLQGLQDAAELGRLLYRLPGRAAGAAFPAQLVVGDG